MCSTAVIYCMRRWGIILVAAVGAGFALLGWFLFVVLQAQSEMIRDAYCQDWASAAIVRYMDDNEGQYPRNWDDLRQPFAQVTADDQSFSFEEVRSRVTIDFNVDPKVVYDSSFEFVRSASGAKWGSPDPNERIRTRILKEQKQASLK